MIRFLFVSLLLFKSLFAQSQDTINFYDYRPLICKGDIPLDFKTELSKLVNQEKEKQVNSSSRDKKQAVTFSELSNYQLNNILYSGKVLYGDVMTEYVNKVADVILKSDPELRGKVRFYVLKNTDLNAFSTQSGIIFISIGLLAQIESEAQLAFVMCHEIVHFRNNHNLETYKKKQELFSERSGMNINNRISSALNYSKENELEADKEGLDMFLKTPYGTNELNNLFDVMLYSYLPFDEIAFDTLYFNSGKGYIMPREYFLTKVSEITAEEDVSDSMSTHPNIKKRRETIQKLLKTKNKSAGASFIQPESEFNKIQRIARYEIAVVYLQDSELEEGLYSGYLIEKIYGKSLFSDKIITGALYARAKQKSQDRYGSRDIKKYTADDFEENESWSKIEGESQEIYHFMYKIPSKELSILAAKKLYECNQLYKSDFFGNRFYSVVYDLVNSFDLNRSSFLNEVISDSLASVSEKASEFETEFKETLKSSKVSKIKKNKATRPDKKDKLKESKYYKYAFMNFYDDSLLDESFTYWQDKKAADEKLKESDNYIAYSLEKDKITAKYGQALAINKMVLINPFFSSYISRYYYEDGYQGTYYSKNPEVTPLEEEEVEHKLVQDVQEYAVKLDLNVTVIGGTQQSAIETDQFNDFQQLINWFSERVALGKMGVYTFNDQYMDKYVDQYGHIGFCYVIKNNKSLDLVFVLFNLKTGGSELVYEKELSKGKPDGIFVKMMLYEIMHQIKQQPDKINKIKKKYNINE